MSFDSAVRPTGLMQLPIGDLGTNVTPAPPSISPEQSPDEDPGIEHLGAYDVLPASPSISIRRLSTEDSSAIRLFHAKEIERLPDHLTSVAERIKFANRLRELLSIKSKHDFELLGRVLVVLVEEVGKSSANAAGSKDAVNEAPQNEDNLIMNLVRNVLSLASPTEQTKISNMCILSTPVTYLPNTYNMFLNRLNDEECVRALFIELLDEDEHDEEVKAIARARPSLLKEAMLRRTYQGWTLFWWGVDGGRVKLLEFMAEVAPVEFVKAIVTQDENGDTPVMLVADDGNLDIWQLLFRVGKQAVEKALVTRNLKGRTPLTWVVIKSDLKSLTLIATEVSEKTLEQAIVMPDDEGNTALTWIAHQGPVESLELIAEKFPMAFAVAMGKRDVEGRTPFLRSVYRHNLAILRAMVKLNKEAVKEVKEAVGQAMLLDDAKGYTPVSWAVVQGDAAHMEMLELMAQVPEFAEAIVKPNPDGYTPVFLAAIDNNCAALAIMIGASKGAVGDATVMKNKAGQTLLLRIVSAGHMQALELLAREVPEDKFTEAMDMEDPDGNTPVSLAACRNRVDILAIMLQVSKKAVGQAMLKKDAAGQTLLSRLVVYGHMQALELLAREVSGKFEEAIVMMDAEGDTPVSLATAAILAILLQVSKKAVGQAVLKKDAAGQTPVLKAVIQHSMDKLTLMAREFPKEFAQAMITQNPLGLTPLLASILTQNRPEWSSFINTWLGDFGFIPWRSPPVIIEDSRAIYNNRAYIFTQLRDWLNNVDLSTCPSGKTFLELPLLFGDFKAFISLIERLPAQKREEGFSILRSTYGDAAEPFIENTIWVLDEKHYSLGGKVLELLPPPPSLSFKEAVVRIWKQASQESEETLKKLETLFKRISNSEEMKGLPQGEEKKAERAIWYEKQCRFLLHALECYKIGQQEGDDEDKRLFLSTLAEMAPWCTSRWKTDLTFLYNSGLQLQWAETSKNEEKVLKEAEESEAKKQEITEISVPEKLHVWLRERRLGIVKGNLPLFEYNDHEYHYFCDLFGPELGLRQPISGDADAADFNDPVTFPYHTKETARERFFDFYNAYTITTELTEYLAHLNLLEVFEWLAQAYGDTWNLDEYDPDRLRQRVAGMKSEGKTDAEITAYLSTLGIVESIVESTEEKIQIVRDKLASSEKILQLTEKRLKTRSEKIAREWAELKAIWHTEPSAPSLLRQKIIAMRSEGYTEKEIIAFLDRYGMSEVEKIQLVQGKPANTEKTPDRITQHGSQLAATLSERSDSSQLQIEKGKVEADIKEMKALLEQVDLSTNDRERGALLASSRFVSKSSNSNSNLLTDANIKFAQRAAFFAHTGCFDEKGRYTRQAVTLLLQSVQVLSRRTLPT